MDLKNPFEYFINLKKRARFKLLKRYNKPIYYYNIKIINDILYNEKTHYVEQFKEFLIYEDYNEFLKRFYKNEELKNRLVKILYFYEKYSKIFANYTVVPESKYMYKNIKKKQKVIDQMRDNGKKNWKLEEVENSDEEISSKLFSSRVMNSIYNKTITTLNKSEIDGNNEQSIINLINKISAIENRINNYSIKSGRKSNKSKKEAFLTIKKLNKELLFSKFTQKINRLNNNYKNIINNKILSNYNLKKKKINIKITNSKEKLQNNTIKNNFGNNSLSKNKNNLNNNPNLVFINSYVHKNKNNIFNNFNSLGITSNSNTSNTLNDQKNSLNTNLSSKQKLPTSLIKQNKINNSNNFNNYKEDISKTNINNYFKNVTNNLKNKKKFKFVLGDTILKPDKIVFSTNSPNSPRIPGEQIFQFPYNKRNIASDKKQHKIREVQNYNKITDTKKINSNLLQDNNSLGNNLNFLTNRLSENKKIKNVNRLNKKKNNKKSNDVPQKKNNSQKRANYIYMYKEIKPNINFYKKAETYRNKYNSKILSEHNSISKNEINNNSNNNNTKNNFKLLTVIKSNLKNNSHKILNSPWSLNNSSVNFQFHSNLNNKKNNLNTIDFNKKTLDEYNKKKYNNYNNINNIHDNNTQININTGIDLYNSLFFKNNSNFNISNISSIFVFSKYPIETESWGNKNKMNERQEFPMNIVNKYNNKSHTKGKNKEKKFNLNIKKLIHKHILEGDKAIFTDRHIGNKKLFEKLGKYFFKNENYKNNSNIIYNFNNVSTNNTSNINIKNINNKSNANNNIKNKKKDKSKFSYNILSENSNSNKILNYKANHNTPIESRYKPFTLKNHTKIKNIYYSSKTNKKIKKVCKTLNKNIINFNNIINN